MVVIGGGFGGATCARYIKQFGPEVKVTLIEPKQTFHTCPGSNWVLGGLQTMDRIEFGYDKLEGHGVEVVHDWVTSIDPENRKVNLKSGGSSIAAPLPKSGYAANTEAKVAAAAIVNLLHGKEPDEPAWTNTCYSLVTPDYGISVAMVYKLQDGRVAKVKGSGGLTPKGADNKLVSVYTRNWYDNITADIWG